MPLTRTIFWLPLLLALGTAVFSLMFRSSFPPVSSVALSLLLSGTMLLSGYLFAVMFQPEKF
jgi:CBS-domain-containing membrane protein